MEKETNGNSHDGGMGRDEISHRISKTDSKVNTEETNHLARNRMNLNRWKELHMQKNDGAATISGGGSVTSGDSFENALVLWSNRRHQSCGGADDSITNSIESSDDDSRKTLLLDPHERIMRNSMNNTHEVTPEKEQEQEQDDTMSLPAMKVKEEDDGNNNNNNGVVNPTEDSVQDSPEVKIKEEDCDDNEVKIKEEDCDDNEVKIKEEDCDDNSNEGVNHTEDSIRESSVNVVTNSNSSDLEIKEEDFSNTSNEDTTYMEENISINNIGDDYAFSRQGCIISDENNSCCNNLTTVATAAEEGEYCNTTNNENASTNKGTSKPPQLAFVYCADNDGSDEKSGGGDNNEDVDNNAQKRPPASEQGKAKTGTSKLPSSLTLSCCGHKDDNAGESCRDNKENDDEKNVDHDATHEPHAYQQHQQLSQHHTMGSVPTRGKPTETPQSLGNVSTTQQSESQPGRSGMAMRPSQPSQQIIAHYHQQHHQHQQHQHQHQQLIRGSSSSKNIGSNQNGQPPLTTTIDRVAKEKQAAAAAQVSRGPYKKSRITDNSASATATATAATATTATAAATTTGQAKEEDAKFVRVSGGSITGFTKPLSSNIITTPTTNDILLGRGGNRNQNNGNVRLRAIARKRCAEYRALQTTHNKKARGFLIEEIRTELAHLTPPIRFLLTSSSVWKEAPYPIVREKIGQCLRDAIQQERNAHASNNIGVPPQQQQVPGVGQPLGLDHAINYVTTIKERFSDEPKTYKNFLEILQRKKKYLKEQRGIKELLEEVSVLFEEHPDLLKEFTLFLPDTVQSKAKEQLEIVVKEAEEQRTRKLTAATKQKSPQPRRKQYVSNNDNDNDNDDDDDDDDIPLTTYMQRCRDRRIPSPPEPPPPSAYEKLGKGIINQNQERSQTGMRKKKAQKKEERSQRPKRQRKQPKYYHLDCDNETGIADTDDNGKGAVAATATTTATPTPTTPTTNKRKDPPKQNERKDQDAKKQKTWTVEEISELRKCIEQFGNDYRLAYSSFPTRSERAVAEKYRKENTAGMPMKRGVKKGSTRPIKHTPGLGKSRSNSRSLLPLEGQVSYNNSDKEELGHDNGKKQYGARAYEIVKNMKSNSIIPKGFSGKELKEINEYEWNQIRSSTTVQIVEEIRNGVFDAATNDGSYCDTDNFTGVSPNRTGTYLSKKNPWRASIFSKYIGCFEKKQYAARAVEIATKMLHETTTENENKKERVSQKTKKKSVNQIEQKGKRAERSIIVEKQDDDENCLRDQIQRRISSSSTKRKKFEGTTESPRLSSTATELTCNKTVAAHVDTDTAVDPVLMEFAVKNKDCFKVPPEMFHKWLVEKWGVASMPDLDEACQEEDFVFSAMWNGGGLKPFKKKKFITAVIDSTMGAGTDSLTSYYASSTYNSIITAIRTGPKEGKTGHD